LDNQNLSAIDITRKLQKYKKQEIQRILYHDLKDIVKISNKPNNYTNITNSIENINDEHILFLLPSSYIQNKNLTNLSGQEKSMLNQSLLKPREKTNSSILNFESSSKYNIENMDISQKSQKTIFNSDYINDINTTKHKIVAIDIDNCQYLVPLLNNYISHDKNSIVKGYYSSGTSLKYNPLFETQKISSGVKDVADCYLQHWISIMSVKHAKIYRYVLVSKDHMLINIKNILIEEGLDSVYCDDEEYLKQLLYSSN
jgi:hypothetical protein